MTGSAKSTLTNGPSAAQIFVEIERARLTKQLAKLKEEEGKVDEAAEILQEVAVVRPSWSTFPEPDVCCTRRRWQQVNCIWLQDSSREVRCKKSLFNPCRHGVGLQIHSTKVLSEAYLPEQGTWPCSQGLCTRMQLCWCANEQDGKANERRGCPIYLRKSIRRHSSLYRHGVLDIPSLRTAVLSQACAARNHLSFMGRVC